MARLKTLVIVMGIVIIAGATVVVTTIVQRGIVQRGGALGEPVARGVIHLPPGARVMETRMDGGHILLRLALAGGGGRLLGCLSVCSLGGCRSLGNPPRDFLAGALGCDPRAVRLRGMSDFAPKRV